MRIRASSSLYYKSAEANESFGMPLPLVRIDAAVNCGFVLARRGRDEELKTAKTILTNGFTIGGIVNVDKHVFFRMTGEKTRKDLDKIFLFVETCLHETFAHVKLVGSFTAI